MTRWHAYGTSISLSNCHDTLNAVSQQWTSSDPENVKMKSVQTLPTAFAPFSFLPRLITQCPSPSSCTIYILSPPGPPPCLPGGMPIPHLPYLRAGNLILQGDVTVFLCDRHPQGETGHCSTNNPKRSSNLMPQLSWRQHAGILLLNSGYLKPEHAISEENCSFRRPYLAVDRAAGLGYRTFQFKVKPRH